MQTEKKDFKSALFVQEGIEQPAQINPHFSKKKRKELSIDNYVEGILQGNRTILSRAITLIESVNPEHFVKAQAIIERVLPYSGNSLRIGITGVPGVGKSTFIEAFGKYITGLGNKLAVLAIDPSSERTKGSILGDKTRMEELSTDENAFIRPSPSGQTLGGVARKTRETIILCEAAGFNVILVETVGVGQSETVVKTMVDFFLLLMLAGAGDELQGIKRGIMEMADSIVINKADGDNVKYATMAQAQHQSAIKLFPPQENGWKVPVKTCSAIEKRNIDKIWLMIKDYERKNIENGFFEEQREQQLIGIFKEWIDEHLRMNFYHRTDIKKKMKELIVKIKTKEITPYQAGTLLFNFFHHKK